MNIRSFILVIVLLLICVGVIMVYSSSAIYANEKYGDSLFFLKRQLLYLLIGFIFAIVIMCIDYNVLQKYARLGLVVSVLLLLAVFLPGLGRQASGAQRWIKIAGISFQPSEFIKLSMTFFLADILASRVFRIQDFFRGLMPILITLGGVLGLILLQPDLGTTFAIACVALIMLFVGGVNIHYLTGLFVSVLPVLYVLVFNVPYRRRRILAFLDPWADPQGVGFQIIQSFVAMGSGGLLGVGLGQSRQKLFYLPHSHTDFIFSIIGEELGIVGSFVVIVLFISLIVAGFIVSARAKDVFGKYLALGLTSLIAIESFINMAVCSGLIPTKGLPLPFISFGGSALIVHMIAIGLLLNISKNRFYKNPENLEFKT